MARLYHVVIWRGSTGTCGCGMRFQNMAKADAHCEAESTCYHCGAKGISMQEGSAGRCDECQ